METKSEALVISFIGEKAPSNKVILSKISGIHKEDIITFIIFHASQKYFKVFTLVLLSNNLTILILVNSGLISFIFCVNQQVKQFIKCKK